MKSMLPKRAKLYIAFVLTAGLAIVLLAAQSWSSLDATQFAIYLALAGLASTLKIRIPGIESTVTPNFLFVILAINSCRFSEVVTITLLAAVIQSVWASAKRPRLVQVAFSAAALVLSAAAAYQFSHLLLKGSALESSSSVVVLAGCIYFPVNSALVAIVVGLASGKSLRQIWGHCDAWTFPYFMGGIVFAALVTSGFNQTSSWKGALVLIPAVILAHLYFKNRSSLHVAEKTSA